jgi:hypothetical protein
LVFANITNFGETQIDTYIQNMADTEELSVESLKGYADFMK